MLLLSSPHEWLTADCRKRVIQQACFEAREIEPQSNADVEHD